MALRSGVTKWRSLLSQVGASEDDLAGGGWVVTTFEKKSLNDMQEAPPSLRTSSALPVSRP